MIKQRSLTNRYLSRGGILKRSNQIKTQDNIAIKFYDKTGMIRDGRNRNGVTQRGTSNNL